MRVKECKESEMLTFVWSNYLHKFVESRYRLSSFDILLGPYPLSLRVLRSLKIKNKNKTDKKIHRMRLVQRG